MCLKLYRISNFFYGKGFKFLARVFFLLNKIFCGAEISPTANIGKVQFFHSVGVVIGGKVTIGDGTVIMSGVVIGAAGYWKNGKHFSEKSGDGQPNIGKNVFIGANAVILGNIEVGNNSLIGANVAVSKNIPSDSKVKLTLTPIIIQT